MKLKNTIIDDYEQAFPWDQEYELWIASMERDYQEECGYRAGLVVTNKTQFKDEEFSPFSTVNS